MHHFYKKGVTERYGWKETGVTTILFYNEWFINTEVALNMKEFPTK
jgi:hypothetical protein